MKPYILIIMLAMAYIPMVKSQDFVNFYQKDDVVLEGSIVDQWLALTPDKEVAVTVTISNFPSNGITAPGVKYVKRVKNKEHFKFVIKATTNMFYMQIGFATVKPLLYWSNFDNIYILEKGDRISCKLTNTYFEFSGKGSAKLNCQSEIYSQRYIGQLKDPLPTQIKQYLNFQNSKRDSILKLRLATVAKFSKSIGETLTNIMVANCYGLRYYMWFRSQQFYLNEPERMHAFFDSEEFRNADIKLLKKIPSRHIIASPNYCDFLFLKLVLNNWHANKIEGKIDDEKAELFNAIFKNYDGLIRQKLLATYFLYYSDQINNLAQLQTAKKLIKKKEYKSILATIRDEKGLNIPFFPFKMEDEQGRMVSLGDFKDKIILMDFWYTGCFNCVQFTKAISPVFVKYQDNPKVKFVSVSIDQNKSEWLASIAEGLYTHHPSINLYAGGKSNATNKTHPLIQRYNIKSYPTLLIIKNGMMYSSAPPKSDNEKLIALIENALAID